MPATFDWNMGLIILFVMKSIFTCRTAYPAIFEHKIAINLNVYNTGDSRYSRSFHFFVNERILQSYHCRYIGLLFHGFVIRGPI